MRDADAIPPTVAQSPRMVIIDAITVEPATDSVASKKISIKGYPVGECKAFSTLPRENKTVRIMPSPSDPFITMVVMMDVGTTLDAFWISSDIYQPIAC